MNKETTVLESITFCQTYEHGFRLFVDEKQSIHGNQDIMNAKEDVLRPPDKSWRPSFDETSNANESICKMRNGLCRSISNQAKKR